MFGFRSKKIYKMIPAVFYLFVMFMVLVFVVFHVPEYAVSSKDKAVCIVHSFLVWLFFFAPYLLLSFGIKDKIPFMKKGQGYTVAGILVTCFMIMAVAIGVNELHSEPYKSAHLAAQDQRDTQKEQQEAIAAVQQEHAQESKTEKNEEADRQEQEKKRFERASVDEKKAQNLLKKAQERFDSRDISGMIKKCDEIAEKYPDTQTSQQINHFISENLNTLPQIECEKLLKEYTDNEVYADSLYKDKTIVVTGYVQNIGKDIFDNPYVTLNKAGEIAINNVQCEFKDEKAIKQLERLSKDNLVKIVGRCVGRTVLSPYLKDCIFVE